jgi:ABC-2 type transport system ATP-binding protein
VVFSVGAEAERAHGLLSSLPGVREAARHDGTVRVTVERGEEGALPLMRALDAAQIPVASMQIARPTLDDVFLTLTGHSLRDEPAGAQGGRPSAGGHP